MIPSPTNLFKTKETAGASPRPTTEQPRTPRRARRLGAPQMERDVEAAASYERIVIPNNISGLHNIDRV